MYKIMLGLALTLISLDAAAFLCPKNFNVISVGDPIDRVIQLCGTPDDKKSYKAAESGPQEWTFNTPSGQAISNLSTSLASIGSTSMKIVLNDNKVASITIMGVGLSSSPMCGGIRVGDSKTKVVQMCGKPSLISQGDTSPGIEGPPPTFDVTELYYFGSPSTILVFENGLLKERKY